MRVRSFAAEQNDVQPPSAIFVASSSSSPMTPSVERARLYLADRTERRAEALELIVARDQRSSPTSRRSSTASGWTPLSHGRSRCVVKELRRAFEKQSDARDRRASRRSALVKGESRRSALASGSRARKKDAKNKALNETIQRHDVRDPGRIARARRERAIVLG
jgi:hypothetical protein